MPRVYSINVSKTTKTRRSVTRLNWVHWNHIHPFSLQIHHSRNSYQKGFSIFFLEMYGEQIDVIGGLMRALLHILKN